MPFPAVPLAPPPGHMLDPIPLPAPAPHPLRTSANGELSISHTNTVDLLASTPFSHRSAGNQKASDWILNISQSRQSHSSEVYLNSFIFFINTFMYSYNHTAYSPYKYNNIAIFVFRQYRYTLRRVRYESYLMLWMQQDI